ncbi:chromosome partitioning protein parA [Acidithiobacillus sp. GGI-221]|nr:chromosome partitioning protein parA [Acidithiobacillus sp. GGI-221]
MELYGRPDRERRLQDALAPVAGFDYALIDCPPALNMLTINALVAADSVLIPMQCEYYALEGLTQLLGTVRRVRAQLNPRLEVHGLLRTMFDNRNRLASEVALELERHFPDKLYQAVVPRNIRLAEAPSFGRAALVYDPACAGSRAYQGVATEFLRREWMK